MNRQVCPFCRLESNRIRGQSEFAASFLDGFPITQGYTLVIPKRHVARLFELPDEEQAAICKLVDKVRASLAVGLQLNGFNVGVNDGTASGQTVMHAHVHIIPRHTGEVTGPRGGVR